MSKNRTEIKIYQMNYITFSNHALTKLQKREECHINLAINMYTLIAM